MIEVDGVTHNRIDRRDHDQQREGVIEDFGIMILRFSNNVIRYQLKQGLIKYRKLQLCGQENKRFPASFAGKDPLPLHGEEHEYFMYNKLHFSILVEGPPPLQGEGWGEVTVILEFDKFLNSL